MSNDKITLDDLKTLRKAYENAPQDTFPYYGMHGTTYVPIHKLEELERENEELKNHYAYTLQAIEDRLMLAEVSDIVISDAFDKIDLSKQWLREKYNNIDWF